MPTCPMCDEKDPEVIGYEPPSAGHKEYYCASCLRDPLTDQVVKRVDWGSGLTPQDVKGLAIKLKNLKPVPGMGHHTR